MLVRSVVQVDLFVGKAWGDLEGGGSREVVSGEDGMDILHRDASTSCL